MELASPIIRIIIGCDRASVQADIETIGGPASSTSSISSGNANQDRLRLEKKSETHLALERLGSEAEIENVFDSEGCLARIESGDVDLVVLDCGPIADAFEVLTVLDEVGPPVLMVVRDADDEIVLEAFRKGASECVRVGPDYAELLPSVALEQIRRWHRQRERGDAERRIRWLEGLHDAIVRQIPAALAVLDGSGQVVTINPECSRLIGISAEQAVGAEFANVFPKDLYLDSGLASMLTEVARGNSVPPRLARGTDAAGAPHVYDVRTELLDEEGRVLLVLSDVTEVEMQAKRIGELQRYNDNIIQNMNSALLVVGTDRHIIFANPTAEKILGVGTGQLVGRRIADWFRSAVAEQHQEQHQEQDQEQHLIVQTLQDGTSFKGAETLATRDDGRMVPIGISSSPLLNDGGERFGAVAIFQDLSEIKQLERQVLQNEKMASIGQLAAGVAHEINNPMGFIHANLFQMSEYLDDLGLVWERLASLQKTIESGAGIDEIRLGSERLREASHQIDLEYIQSDFVKAVSESQEGSERIRHIVRDLREFSHQDESQPTPADVNHCVDSTANIVWTMMKHVVILKKDYAELPPLHCFPMQLKQVFMNLLVNACHAIEEKVGDSGATGVVEIQTLAREGGVSVVIRDSGVGISDRDLDRIFDPFFTTKDVGVGTGLGLSTSYNIIKRHGGEIQVHSHEGVGTTFEVWLPGVSAELTEIGEPIA